ncbi:MAG TPA: ATP-binding protein, partial [Gemmatimonadales bacterium]|nr:ATP-binding protein [Gemmatimonadales bacterium]
NAVRHGVAPHREPGRVEIRAEQRGGRLSLVVRDSGKGMPEGANGTVRREGVGLTTTRARLQGLYGSEQELTLVNLPGGFETRVSFPLRRSEGGERDDSMPGR